MKSKFLKIAAILSTIATFTVTSFTAVNTFANDDDTDVEFREDDLALCPENGNTCIVVIGRAPIDN